MSWQVLQQIGYKVGRNIKLVVERPDEKHLINMNVVAESDGDLRLNSEHTRLDTSEQSAPWDGPTIPDDGPEIEELAVG